MDEWIIGWTRESIHPSIHSSIHPSPCFLNVPLEFLQHPAPRARRPTALAVRREGRRLCAGPRAARAAHRAAARKIRREKLGFALAAETERRVAAAGKCFSARCRTARRQYGRDAFDGRVAARKTLADSRHAT